MTSVVINTYAHSVTYVSDNILKSLKDIIVSSGLNPTKLVDDRDVLHRGISAWLKSGHLKQVTLEIFDPATDKLIVRWDLDIVYGYGSDDGNFWTDTSQLRYHILKAGLAPSQASYRVLVNNDTGRPDVDGWSSCSARSTEGFVRQSLGSTISHNGLGAGAAYWRKTG